MSSRAHVGPEELFEVIGKHQFDQITYAGVKKTSRVLDYGCGCLRLGKHLIPYLRKGYYTGIDVDEKVIEDGKAELEDGVLKKKAPTLLVGDPTNFDQVESIPTHHFDFAIYHSIFNHCSVEQIRSLLVAAKWYLKGGGYIMGTFLEGDSDYEGTEWNYPLAHTYTRETIENLLIEERFLVADIGAMFFEHPTGQTWFMAQAYNEDEEPEEVEDEEPQVSSD
jgi:SAM-dependent methyltransferase